MPGKRLPMEDTTTPVLRGEKWVDVMGFKGAYQVSSFGRVRSVERTRRVLNRWNHVGVVSKPGYIRKQKMQIYKGEYTESPSYNCSVTLYKGRREYTVRVARLVYEHFIGPLAKGLKVTHKDGDGRNNHYKNLLALNAGGIRRLAFKNGRQPLIQSLMSEAVKKRTYKKLSEKGKRPVQRISAGGKVLKNFASIEEAAADAPCDRNYLTHVLKGRKKHVKGKFYQYTPNIQNRWTVSG